MEEIKNLNSKLKEFFSKIKNKKAFLTVVMGISGIVLIFLSEIIPSNDNEYTKTYDNQSTDISEQEIIIENRLEDAVSKIYGAGKTDITITYDSSKEIFYAENFSENRNSSETEKKSELVIIDGANGEEPVVIKTDEAKIRGVLVVCEGGENPLVREKIIEAICALLDISSNKVSVAKMA